MITVIVITVIIITVIIITGAKNEQIYWPRN